MLHLFDQDTVQYYKNSFIIHFSIYFIILKLNGILQKSL